VGLPDQRLPSYFAELKEMSATERNTNVSGDQHAAGVSG
jgi:hypothetical protein